MEIIFKKPNLGTTCTGESTSVSVSPGITCSLYPAIKAAPTNAEIESFKDDLKKVNKNFGLRLYMNAGSEKVPTRVGLAPLGGYLSYQMAEGNFKVTCNVDLSKQPASSEDVPRTIYPSFPLSLVSPLFIVTQCSSEQKGPVIKYRGGGGVGYEKLGVGHYFLTRYNVTIRLL